MNATGFQGAQPQAYRFASKTSTSPLTTGTLFTFTGGIEILRIVGTVTTVVQAQVTTVKLSITPDAQTPVDICATKDVNAFAGGVAVADHGHGGERDGGHDRRRGDGARDAGQPDHGDVRHIGDDHRDLRCGVHGRDPLGHRLAPADGRGDARLVDITHALPRWAFRLVADDGTDYGIVDARNPIDPRWNGEVLHRETGPRGNYLSFVRPDKRAQRVQLRESGAFVVAIEDPAHEALGSRVRGVGTWTLVAPATVPEPLPLETVAAVVAPAVRRGVGRPR